MADRNTIDTVLNVVHDESFVAMCLDYLDGALDESEIASFKAQLASDPAKRQSFVLLMHRVQLLREGLGATALAAQLAVEPPVPRRRRPLRWAMAAALVIALSLGRWYASQPTVDPAAPATDPATVRVVVSGGDIDSDQLLRVLDTTPRPSTLPNLSRHPSLIDVPSDPQVQP